MCEITRKIKNTTKPILGSTYSSSYSWLNTKKMKKIMMIWGWAQRCPRDYTITLVELNRVEGIGNIREMDGSYGYKQCNSIYLTCRINRSITKLSKKDWLFWYL